MHKPLLHIACAFLAALSLSGCFGVVGFTPDGCKNQTPGWSTKTAYLEQWGKPDKIIATVENTEIWSYHEKDFVWCGVVPILILPLPLVLPVCKEYDYIEFYGDEAKRHEYQIIRKFGFYCGEPTGRYPCSTFGGDSLHCGDGQSKRDTATDALSKKPESPYWN